MLLVFSFIFIMNQIWAEDRPVYRAEDFVESIGLAASPFAGYISQGRWKGAGTKYPPEFFFDLGVRYYRCGLKNALVKDDQPEKVLEWWKKTGARPMLLVDQRKIGTVKTNKVKKDGDFSQLLALVKRYQAGVIAEIEGPNELNNKFPPQELNMKYKGLTDEKAGTKYQQDLYNALKSDPATKDIPIVMYTSIFSDYSLGKGCDAFDYLNMHSYQGSKVPSSSLLMNITRTVNVLPKGATIKPLVPTECGYNVEQDKTNQQGFIGSLQAQCLNNPMLLAEYFRHGVKRTYLFALHNADGYGHLNSGQEIKRPSWYALQSLIKILADAKWNQEKLQWDGGRSFTPRALLFNISGAPETVHTLTLQKENGDWYLLIWNEVINDRHGRDIKNKSVPVTLTFTQGTPVDCVAVYEQGRIPRDVFATPEGPKQGAFSKQAKTPKLVNNKLNIKVPSALKIIQLRPLKKATGAAPATPVVSGNGTSDSVTVNVSLPEKSGAESVLIFRNDWHIATIPAKTKVSYTDKSSWIRPGYGYRFAAQTVAKNGLTSKKVETVIKTPNKFPDLIVGDFGPVKTNINPRDMVQFKGAIVNVGNGSTPAADKSAGMYSPSAAITFQVDGKTVSWGGEKGDKPMRPGQSNSVIASGGPNGGKWKATPGTHILRAFIDDVNRIPAEGSESNNTASKTITVGDYAGKLYVESRPALYKVELAKEGTLDWVAFTAWKDKGSLARKKGANLISPVAQVGKGHIALTGGSPLNMNWTGGEGKAEASNSHMGLWGNCQGNGFTFSVPADSQERVLKIYVSGIEGIQGEFSASLSDNSAPKVIDDSWHGNRAKHWSPVPGDFSAVYTVKYRASKPGQKLTVSWTLKSEPNQFRGQIRMQGATLSKYTQL